MKQYARLLNPRMEDNRVAVVSYNLGRGKSELRLIYPIQDLTSIHDIYSYFEVTGLMEVIGLFDTEAEAKEFYTRLKDDRETYSNLEFENHQHMNEILFSCRAYEMPEFKRDEQGAFGGPGYVAYPTIYDANHDLEEGQVIMEYKTWWLVIKSFSTIDKTSFYKSKVSNRGDDEIVESHSF